MTAAILVPEFSCLVVEENETISGNSQLNIYWALLDLIGLFIYIGQLQIELFSQHLHLYILKSYISISVNFTLLVNE